MKYENVTISSSDSLSTASGAINDNQLFCGFETDASWTAAAVSFAELSADGVTFIPVNFKDLAGEYVTETIQPSTFTPIDIQTFLSCRKLKVRSGTSGTPVAQTNETTIELQIIEFN